jgi:hypothetical protein
MKGGVFAVGLLLAMCVLAAPALGGNGANPKLDAAAALVSGDSTLLAYCENDQTEWDRWVALAGFPAGESLLGFTFTLNPDPLTGGHFVYVSPGPCFVLTAFVARAPSDLDTSLTYEQVGAAILVLTHESMHQRLHSLDEALVQCNAMKYLSWVIQTVFQSPETIVVSKRVRVRVRRHGRWIRVWRVQVHRASNPEYTAMIAGAVLLDADTPAEYHGAKC